MKRRVVEFLYRKPVRATLTAIAWTVMITGIVAAAWLLITVVIVLGSPLYA